MGSLDRDGRGCEGVNSRSRASMVCGEYLPRRRRGNHLGECCMTVARGQKPKRLRGSWTNPAVQGNAHLRATCRVDNHGAWAWFNRPAIIVIPISCFARRTGNRGAGTPT